MTLNAVWQRWRFWRVFWRKNRKPSPIQFGFLRMAALTLWRQPILADDTEAGMAGKVDELVERFRAVIQDAFDAGRQEGAEEARAAILKVLNAPAHQQKPEPWRPATISETSRATRAPRGSLRAVIRRVLRAEPGLNGLEIEDRVAKLDSQVSPKSVGGELRRMKGKVYRQEGHQWFLCEHESAGPPDKQDPADLLTQ